VREVLDDVKAEERGMGGRAFDGLSRRFTDRLDQALAAGPATR
jgi:hypothetical protein